MQNAKIALNILGNKDTNGFWKNGAVGEGKINADTKLTSPKVNPKITAVHLPVTTIPTTNTVSGKNAIPPVTNIVTVITSINAIRMPFTAIVLDLLLFIHTSLEFR